MAGTTFQREFGQGTATVDAELAARTGLLVTDLPYGAVGNGVADDRTSIQNAINAADPAIGGCGVVLFPATATNVYLVGSTLYLKTGVVLRGVSRNTSIKLMTGAACGLLYNWGISLASFDGEGVVIDANQDSDLGVENLTLDGNRLGQTPGGQYSVLWFNNVVRPVVKNCIVKNGTKHNIEYWKALEGKVTDNWSLSAGVTSVMMYKRNQDVHVTNNIIDGAGLDAGIGTGVVVDNNSLRTIVAHNTILAAGWDGINMEEGAINGIIADNEISGAGRYGISTTDGQTGTDTYGIEITDNRIISCGSHGIWGSGTRTSTVQNNVITSPGGCGIYFQTGTSHTADDVLIERNTIRSAGSQGLRVDAGLRPKFRFNTIDSPAADGIMAYDTTDAEIEANDIYHADSANSGGNIASIQVYGATGSTNTRIKRNNCRNPDNTHGAKWHVWTRIAGVTGTRIHDNNFDNHVSAAIANNDTSSIIDMETNRINGLKGGGPTSGGNASVTLSSVSSPTYIFSTVLTANRTATLPTTSLYAGLRYRFERTEAATGKFSLTIGSSCVLAPGQFCEVVYDGSAWQLERFGLLTAGPRVGADNGDAAVTLTVGANEPVQVWATALTANRAVTLSTTGARSGDWFEIIRKATATGASTLDVGTGPLKSLPLGSRCIVRYDGAAWILAEYGLL